MKKPLLSLLAAGTLLWSSCSLPSDVFEKDVVIPGHQWASSFKPRVDFTIKGADTADRYNIYLVLRHSDAYLYNNIWIRGTVRQPGDSIPKSQRY
ncbi:MAG TPA: hypothetical protein VHC50_11630, partial [Puia sp.]|nr:hypothetical protein [Puia sp.]